VNRSRPQAKLSRALGIPLTPKCVRYLEARPYPPGVHGRRRRSLSGYALRLREKQRLRHQYNVGEAQLRRTFERARRMAGKTGELLVAELECRLDAVTLRAGFARSIYAARQLVVHGHLEVNGRKVDRPSYRLAVGDIVTVRERSRHKAPFVVAAAGAHAGERTPPYLGVELASLRAQLRAVPRRDEVPVVCDEQLVVEFYAR
jgi:small subunit ribosomal protein S4